MTGYRPRLLSCARQNAGPPLMALWISRRGTPMSGSAIYRQVCDRTQAEFGQPVTRHFFRDAAATEIAISAPEQIHLIPTILGHASLTTSERHYNQATTLQAGRKLQGTIAALRQQARTRRKAAR